MILDLVLLLLFVAFLVTAYFLVGLPIWVMTHGGPYVAIPDEKLRILLSFIDIKPGLKVADLGSGDGKLLIALAKKGVHGDGFEINRWLVKKSKKIIKQQKLDDKITIYHQNFWNQDISKYNVIVVYGISYIMQRLETKCEQELLPGAIVVSNGFEFPNKYPVAEQDRVYLYQF